MTTSTTHSQQLPSKSKGKQILCKVRMLDDQEIPFHIDPKATGQDLYDNVCNYLELLESDYFALEFYDAHKNAIWLEMDKPVLKQVTETKFNMCVKFYTPDPGQLEEEFTRYLFALQIKRDLEQGTLLCSDNTAALLASYIVQESYNNDPRYMGGRCFFPPQVYEHEIRIMNYHKNHVGQTPADADLNLLDIARKVELYGIKMHTAKDHESVNLNLSVAHMGILVFQNYTKINTFSWAKIRKLSFKRKKFLIKLQPEGYGYYKDTVEFYFDTRDQCKIFWKKCIEYHAFFRCVSIKRPHRNKSKLLTRGSSFRYAGRTQKEIVEYAREHYVKNRTFLRSYSSTRNVAPLSTRSLRSPQLKTSDTMRSQDTTVSSADSRLLRQQQQQHHHHQPDKHQQHLNSNTNNVNDNYQYYHDDSSTHGSRTLDSRFSREKYDLSGESTNEDEDNVEVSARTATTNEPLPSQTVNNNEYVEETLNNTALPLISSRKRNSNTNSNRLSRDPSVDIVEKQPSQDNLIYRETYKIDLNDPERQHQDTLNRINGDEISSSLSKRETSNYNIEKKTVENRETITKQPQTAIEGGKSSGSILVANTNANNSESNHNNMIGFELYHNDNNKKDESSTNKRYSTALNIYNHSKQIQQQRSRSLCERHKTIENECDENENVTDEKEEKNLMLKAQQQQRSYSLQLEHSLSSDFTHSPSTSGSSSSIEALHHEQLVPPSVERLIGPKHGQISTTNSKHYSVTHVTKKQKPKNIVREIGLVKFLPIKKSVPITKSTLKAHSLPRMTSYIEYINKKVLPSKCSLSWQDDTAQTNENENIYERIKRQITSKIVPLPQPSSLSSRQSVESIVTSILNQLCDRIVKDELDMYAIVNRLVDQACSKAIQLYKLEKRQQLFSSIINTTLQHHKSCFLIVDKNSADDKSDSSRIRTKSTPVIATTTDWSDISRKLAYEKCFPSYPTSEKHCLHESDFTTFSEAKLNFFNIIRDTNKMSVPSTHQTKMFSSSSCSSSTSSYASSMDNRKLLNYPLIQRKSPDNTRSFTARLLDLSDSDIEQSPQQQQQQQLVTITKKNHKKKKQKKPVSENEQSKMATSHIPFGCTSASTIIINNNDNEQHDYLQQQQQQQKCSSLNQQRRRVYLRTSKNRKRSSSNSSDDSLSNHLNKAGYRSILKLEIILKIVCLFPGDSSEHRHRTSNSSRLSLDNTSSSIRTNYQQRPSLPSTKVISELVQKPILIMSTTTSSDNKRIDSTPVKISTIITSGDNLLSPSPPPPPSTMSPTLMGTSETINDDKTRIIPVLHEQQTSSTLPVAESKSNMSYSTQSHMFFVATKKLTPNILQQPTMTESTNITTIPTSLSSTLITSTIHDRAFYICKEMLMTERTYKKDLEVIADAFRRELTILIEHEQDETLANFMDLLFSNIVPIYDFHIIFLKKFEQRIAFWESRWSGNNNDTNNRFQHIDDLVLHLIDILPNYEKYVENYEKLLDELEIVLKRNKRFDLFYKEFASQKFCYLSFISFLLKPLQRLLHYRQLLGKLLKYYEQNNYVDDYQRCYEVFIKIRDHIENFTELLSIF
ncbi:unnamed protein product, partial [Didymodactylos carnosus]